MTGEKLLMAMTDIDGAYIEATAARLTYSPHRCKRAGRNIFRRGVALAAAVLLMAALGTGVIAASPEIREAVTELIESIFPPRDMNVNLEGNEYTLSHSPQGSDPTESDAGFVIYVDEEHYSLVSGADGFFVRPRGEFYNPELPPCELEIKELPETAPREAAENARASTSGWTELGELTAGSGSVLYYFTAGSGQTWDAPWEEHRFYDNGSGGCFHVTLRCFMEATEGHGMRLYTMLDTFQVLGSGEKN